jgi:tripartite-type tricarboxylate transporter receptor subunit TctC
MHPTRPLAMAIASVLVVVGACARGHGPEQWPRRPVRVIVPAGPGVSTDLAARLVAPLLAERWHRPVVVDNRPGGDGVTGVQAFVVANDQHTLLFAPMGVVTTNPLLHDRLPFDPVLDLVPIAAVAKPNIGIAAVTTARVASLADLVALVRRHPGEYLWAATPGLPELVFRAFLALEKLEMKHVAYREIPPAVRDLGAGRIHLLVAALPTLSPVLEIGAARLLAVTAKARAPAAPDVPTATEAGYPALTVEGPFGFFGWRGIPVEVRNRIAADVRHAVDDRTVASRLAKAGFVVAAGTPEDFARALAEQRAQVEGIARIVGLKRPGEGGR